ncbi:MAG: hypothetical protein JXO22_13305 [Phycisphaerae bacterium]|nr:hypothetical protein [Phycisphaerae bacterium]
MAGGLLAVDLGLHTGLALYNEQGRLVSYRSQHFGNADSLKRRVRTLLDEHPDLGWLVLEGGGQLARIWEYEARRRRIAVRRISAETWRKQMFYPREQRGGQLAKRNADQLARKVIDWSDAAKPTSLRHDAAEAILVGLWGVMKVGWLKEPPPKMNVRKD